MDGEAGAVEWCRAPRVVWRLTSRAVLAQRIDGEPESSSAELTGWAARVWVALDEPACLEQLCERLGTNPAQLDEAVRSLVDSGFVQARHHPDTGLV